MEQANFFWKHTWYNFVFIYLLYRLGEGRGNPNPPCLLSKVITVLIWVDYVLWDACWFSLFIFDRLGMSGPKFLLSRIKWFFYRLGFFRSAYWKRCNPAPLYRCGSFTLIRCVSTLEPGMYRCVDCIKVIGILLLMHPHTLDHGCCQFVARWLSIHFRSASEATKGKNCQRWWS